MTLAPLNATLGDGWELLGGDVAGEFLLRSYLAQEITETEAVDAATGWGGDRYAIYRDEASGAQLLLLATTWDTPEAAAEFAAAIYLRRAPL